MKRLSAGGIFAITAIVAFLLDIYHTRDATFFTGYILGAIIGVILYQQSKR